MFSEINVMGCFPTPIWLLSIANHQELNRPLIAVIDKIRAAEKWDTRPLVGREGLGDHLQTRDDLHTLKEFAAFNQMAINAAKQVFERLQYEYETFYITGCWANVSIKGYSHKEHVHPNNFLSGVYYAKAHPGCGPIVFDDPRPQVKVLIPNIKAPNLYNTHNFEIQPKEGDLVLFPSWLPHRVRVNTTDQERVSVSFNIMFKGKFGFERAAASL